MNIRINIYVMYRTCVRIKLDGGFSWLGFVPCSLVALNVHLSSAFTDVRQQLTPLDGFHGIKVRLIPRNVPVLAPATIGCAFGGTRTSHVREKLVAAFQEELVVEATLIQTRMDSSEPVEIELSHKAHQLGLIDEVFG
jgi:hypothetical protein